MARIMRWKRRRKKFRVTVLVFFGVLVVTIYRRLMDRVLDTNALLNIQAETSAMMVFSSNHHHRNYDTLSLPAFGLEIEFLFPSSSMANDTNHTMKFIHSCLEEAGIPNDMFLFKSAESKSVVNKFTWKVTGERSGFELVSPFHPSMDSIEIVLGVMKRMGVQVHPYSTIIHVSVDVRDTSITQIRNVYKNFIVIEKALDEIRPFHHRSNRIRKSTSLAKEFPSIRHAFEQLDACPTIACLRKVASPNSGRPGFAPHWYLMMLRKDKSRRNDDNGGDMFPLRLEFRGQQSTTDSRLVTAWIQLLRGFVQSSLNGIVLKDTEQTTDEVWKDLFDILVPNESLRSHFNQQRQAMAHEAEAYLALERSILSSDQPIHSDLRYGMDMEYLFPIYVQDETKVDMMYAMRDWLESVGVSNHVYPTKKGSKIVSSQDWKIVKEREGFELVSPLDPSLESIVKAVNVMRNVDAQLDRNTVVHVSVDARDATVNQVRRVFKNFVVMEKAFDEIRHAEHRAGRTRKATSIIAEFSSTQDAFDKLDACETIKCLTQTALPKCSKPKNDPHYYVLSLRRAIYFENDRDEVPQKWEFRGMQSTVDSHFAAAWVSLAYSFVRESYRGKELDAQERTVDEAWSELFHDIIQNDDLRRFFDVRRMQFKRGMIVS